VCSLPPAQSSTDVEIPKKEVNNALHLRYGVDLASTSEEMSDALTRSPFNHDPVSRRTDGWFPLHM